MESAPYYFEIARFDKRDEVRFVFGRARQIYPSSYAQGKMKIAAARTYQVMLAAKMQRLAVFGIMERVQIRHFHSVKISRIGRRAYLPERMRLH